LFLEEKIEPSDWIEKIGIEQTDQDCLPGCVVLIEWMGESAAIIIASPEIEKTEERLQTNLQYLTVAKTVQSG